MAEQQLPYQIARRKGYVHAWHRTLVQFSDGRIAEAVFRLVRHEALPRQQDGDGRR